MTSDDARSSGECAPARGPIRGYVRFSATVARTVCTRVIAGESLTAICSEPGLPSRNSLAAWARERPDFGGSSTGPRRWPSASRSVARAIARPRPTRSWPGSRRARC
ncbi:hypothetical protein [Phenylobacterium sp.]|uniref:terminase small subunit-like protein n=1 Tax=Phenylobacterium sp. TaxID=1871053 RepID=UPI0039C98A06